MKCREAGEAGGAGSRSPESGLLACGMASSLVVAAQRPRTQSLAGCRRESGAVRRDGVVAAAVEGVALEDAAGGEPGAAERAVEAVGVEGVPAAGGVEAALAAYEGGEGDLV